MKKWLFFGLLCTSVAWLSLTVLNKPKSFASAQINECGVNDTANWCQVQRDPQRTGYSPEVLGTNFNVEWVHTFSPERVFPQVQAIIYNDKVFVGTEMGNMYALDATTGNQVWTYSVGAPILASVAVDNGRVFFGAMDGVIYALDSNNGNLIWKSSLLVRHGFSTAPLLADNKVMLGSRNGVFYALDPDSGNTLWQYDVGAPILQTAAFNNGRVFFGAMNMRVYALDTANGTLVWVSEINPGMAFKDYWPVIHKGAVVIRPMIDGWGVIDPISCDTNPSSCLISLFVYDETTGQELPTVQHSGYPVMNGAMSPPCVDRNGMLVIGYNGSYGSWSELNLSTRMIENSFVDDSNGEGGIHNGDETANVSCSENLIITLHTNEDTGDYRGPSYSGFFNLDDRTWTMIQRGLVDWSLWNNTQGGGGNAASIANGMVYHISLHQVIARSTGP